LSKQKIKCQEIKCESLDMDGVPAWCGHLGCPAWVAVAKCPKLSVKKKPESGIGTALKAKEVL